ncbi:MAG: hypothetical protein WCS69_02620 [Ignavibacteriaceae bacterium]|jgi:hypothetical protein
MSEIPDELINEMDELYKAGMIGQAKMEALEEDATKALKEFALKHYPEIHNLEKEGFEALDDAIWHVVDRYVRDIDRITYTMQIKE